MPYHHGDLDNALLDAAIAWLDERGTIPSLRALAEACGVSHGAPYRHFADADDLRGAIAARCFDALTAAIRAATDPVTDPRERLAAGCRAYVAWGFTHPARYALMFGLRSPVTTHERCGAAARGAFGTLVEGLAGAGAADPPRAAAAAWAALHGAVDLARQGLGAPTGSCGPDAVADDVIAMIVRAVEPR